MDTKIRRTADERRFTQIKLIHRPFRRLNIRRLQITQISLCPSVTRRLLRPLSHWQRPVATAGLSHRYVFRDVAGENPLSMDLCRCWDSITPRHESTRNSNLRNLCNLRIFNLLPNLRIGPICVKSASIYGSGFSFGGSTHLNHRVPGCHGVAGCEV